MKTTQQIAEELCIELSLRKEWQQHIKADLDNHVIWCEDTHTKCKLFLDWESVSDIVYECSRIGELSDSMLFALKTKQLSEFELSFMTPDDFEKTGYGRTFKK